MTKAWLLNPLSYYTWRCCSWSSNPSQLLLLKVMLLPLNNTKEVTKELHLYEATGGHR
jgi:hypothetical protein